ncbi:MAG: radical SAM protein [Candidatus Gastranaerophilales bacterium]|nr:radical SAM protein [Candidatus Gastranaerophilales bacterium]
MSKITNEKLILDGHKLQWHKDRVKSWLNGDKIAPITIDCALTRACSYRCIYCYSTLQENKGYNLSKDVIFRFLDDAAEIGVKAVSFVSDGESSLSPHVYDAILHGKANGLDMAMGTNGFALKDERLEEILPALTYLRFNISAGTAERYAYIHGVNIEAYNKVIETIKKSVEIKRKRNLEVTIGLQMVLLPDFIDDIIPLAILGKNLDVDYLVIKHCSDDEEGSLGVQYDKYDDNLMEKLKEAENYSSKDYLVKAKWSKIESKGKRTYSKCYGPPFIIQMSGSGLIAPCGMLFNDKYKEKFHIGNINEKSFKEIWQSDRYWEVMRYITSDEFDAKKDCGTLCLQHKVNEFLRDLKANNAIFDDSSSYLPQHINFI